jgi:hypothetical protein
VFGDALPVAISQLTDAIPAHTPSWYVVYQGLIGLASLPSD